MVAFALFMGVCCNLVFFCYCCFVIVIVFACVGCFFWGDWLFWLVFSAGWICVCTVVIVALSLLADAFAVWFLFDMIWLLCWLHASFLCLFCLKCGCVCSWLLTILFSYFSMLLCWVCWCLVVLPVICCLPVDFGLSGFTWWVVCVACFDCWCYCYLGLVE